jgi:hypothetical protein
MSSQYRLTDIPRLRRKSKPRLRLKLKPKPKLRSKPKLFFSLGEGDFA